MRSRLSRSFGRPPHSQESLRTLADLGAPPRSPDRPHLPAVPATAVEPAAAVGLEPRHCDAWGHCNALQNLSRLGIDPPKLALLTFPGGVPELAFDPGDPGDEPVGFDAAQDPACLGIELMDLPVAILPHPEAAFGPGEA